MCAHITAQSDPVILLISHYNTNNTNNTKGYNGINDDNVLVTKISHQIRLRGHTLSISVVRIYAQSVCVCVCVFIKLHITAQSGPVILVILCHSH